MTMQHWETTVKVKIDVVSAWQRKGRWGGWKAEVPEAAAMRRLRNGETSVRATAPPKKKKKVQKKWDCEAWDSSQTPLLSSPSVTVGTAQPKLGIARRQHICLIARRPQQVRLVESGKQQSLLDSEAV